MAKQTPTSKIMTRSSTYINMKKKKLKQQANLIIRCY